MKRIKLKTESVYVFAFNNPIILLLAEMDENETEMKFHLIIIMNLLRLYRSYTYYRDGILGSDA